ncbi:hypothetical protein [Spirochaeta africana]|uniref:Uncharacterized protein n=1 Tax=Spirochaeta africana (strain ATCC 700263 / DSM 8902 / Z-7692) TaxID=889378 RepID=H9UIE5_SPIAZ|nr:hypothetical protein [Spirochaeta africana]AFG37288.1 hypothetical protein Spiaf_1210 [Spirochaeta africana DSM 8902]
MNLISRKKRIYPVQAPLREYLAAYDRTVELQLGYDDLMDYYVAAPYYDSSGRDTLWITVQYHTSEQDRIHAGLLHAYSCIRADGDLSFVRHLVVDRVDLCTYGNTQPFRIRILNPLNENFDYFYIKQADASRIYGLELEHLLSPNRLSFQVSGDTLAEEHIVGIPGDKFIESRLQDDHLDEVRLAKEFVKFNERCFLRLLGDMHSNNFVIEVMPDFEETIYRIRAIDFDQQCYEGNYKVYLPQFFKQNNPIIQLGLRCMQPETTRQYQHEERSLMQKRMQASWEQLTGLLDVMQVDTIAPAENVASLGQQLAEYHHQPDFARAESMGAIVRLSLSMLDTLTASG